MKKIKHNFLSHDICRAMVEIGYKEKPLSYFYDKIPKITYQEAMEWFLRVKRIGIYIDSFDASGTKFKWTIGRHTFVQPNVFKHSSTYYFSYFEAIRWAIIDILNNFNIYIKE